ncbi:hypothetical protein CC86DRAFT_411622 [Ophiobolus disseminans]|uniref:Uncharacterized protein n=1 Tax=Ophiobolus disseminans TaxID=1469910 RepID=A0A6A6ZJE7_9PLEO|nr:hypothetical protein CC86DRAFT_411622 [Ophiobolus disseminans]
MEDLDAAKATFVDVWASSDYTNVLSLKHILNTNFLGEETAWTEYMQRCDRRIKEVDPRKRWAAAETELYGKTKSKYWFFGEEPAQWTKPLPENLWSQGTGQCTAFAVRVNQSLNIGGTYNEYPRQHRNASKMDSASKATIIIDAGYGEAFQLQDGESKDACTNVLGKVKWRGTDPVEVASHEEAMNCCLNQLVKKGRYALVLHRKPIVDTEMTFGANTTFSGPHQALRLQEPTENGQVTVHLIIFGASGSPTDKEDCLNLLSTHLRSLGTAPGAVRSALCAEIINIFEQASSHWGNPKLAVPVEVADSNDKLRAWPFPEF